MTMRDLKWIHERIQSHTHIPHNSQSYHFSTISNRIGIVSIGTIDSMLLCYCFHFVLVLYLFPSSVEDFFFCFVLFCVIVISIHHHFGERVPNIYTYTRYLRAKSSDNENGFQLIIFFHFSFNFFFFF